MKLEEIKRYFVYLVRWQLSTPILAIVLILLASMNKWTATVIANLIGGLIFFWIDRFIFKNKLLFPQWEVKEEVSCSDCGEKARGYRLVMAKNYDKSNDLNPKFRCEYHSREKIKKLKKEGIVF